MYAMELHASYRSDDFTAAPRFQWTSAWPKLVLLLLATLWWVLCLSGYEAHLLDGTIPSADEPPSYAATIQHVSFVLRPIVQPVCRQGCAENLTVSQHACHYILAYTLPHVDWCAKFFLSDTQHKLVIISSLKIPSRLHYQYLVKVFDALLTCSCKWLGFLWNLYTLWFIRKNVSVHLWS